MRLFLLATLLCSFQTQASELNFLDDIKDKTPICAPSVGECINSCATRKAFVIIDDPKCSRDERLPVGCYCQ